MNNYNSFNNNLNYFNQFNNNNNNNISFNNNYYNSNENNINSNTDDNDIFILNGEPANGLQQHEMLQQNINNNNDNYSYGGGSSNYFRTLVSGKKKRFIQDGFNLDLSYVTERIIAMGYPADTSVHKMFRNDINHVYNFFETYHKNHWKIVNVAQEISYSHTKLGGNVIIEAFEDHTPPPFLQLLRIIDVIDQWLSLHPENVVAVHCKAGKGRTGTVISSYLIHMLKNNVSEVFATSDSILSTTLNFFNSTRSKSGECVTVPSQKRYIGYYISYLRDEVSYQSLLTPPVFRISNIELLFLPSSITITSIEIHNRYNPNIKSLPIILHRNSSTTISNNSYCRFEPTNIRIDGDVMVKFNQESQCVFRVVVHTSFIKQPLPGDNGITILTFGRAILDGATHGAMNDNRLSNDFQLKIVLESANQQSNILNNYSPIPPPRLHQYAQTQSMIQLNSNPTPPPVPDRSKKPILSYQQKSTTTDYTKFENGDKATETTMETSTTELSYDDNYIL